MSTIKKCLKWIYSKISADSWKLAKCGKTAKIQSMCAERCQDYIAKFDMLLILYILVGGDSIHKGHFN